MASNEGIMYKHFWSITKERKDNLIEKFSEELPALRGKVGASQEEVSSSIGISRQTYSAYENHSRPIPWSVFLALLFYFDYIPSTHNIIRRLGVFPDEIDQFRHSGSLSQSE